MTILLEFQVSLSHIEWNEPEEQYIRKKTHMLIALRFWVGSGVLTFLYEMLMAYWCQIIPTFSYRKNPTNWIEHVSS